MRSPLHLLPRASEGLSRGEGGLDRQSQMEGIQVQPQIAELAAEYRQRPIELHARTVLRWAGSWFASCSCGFVSTGCLSEQEAWTSACEVENLLLISAQRKRDLYAGGGR